MNSLQNRLFAKLLTAAIIAISVLGFSLSNAQNKSGASGLDKSTRNFGLYYNNRDAVALYEARQKERADKKKRKREQLALKQAELEFRTSQKNKELRKEADKRNPAFVRELKSILELADNDKTAANLALIKFIGDNSKYINVDPVLLSQVELVRDHLAP